MNIIGKVKNVVLNPSDFHRTAQFEAQFLGKVSIKASPLYSGRINLFFSSIFCNMLTKGISLYTSNRIKKSIEIIGSFLVCGEVCQVEFTSEQDHPFQHEYLCSDSRLKQGFMSSI